MTPGSESRSAGGRDTTAGWAGDIAIGLLGDVMLGRGVGSELRFRDPHELWESALRELASSLDAVICNLECSISERGTPTALVEAKPFFFRAPPVAVAALDAIGVRAVTLANNHALDFGPEALSDTLIALDTAAIQHAGAGRDAQAARRSASVRTTKGPCVALIGATDHPIEYRARPSAAGVAYASMRQRPPEWLLEEISRVREQCEVLIVSPHWGHNMTMQPANWQQNAAVALQDAGADLVAGHSAHVFHGVGWTSAGPILYDLGDALDDYQVDPWLRNDLGIFAIWRPADRALELVGLRLQYAHTGLAHDADADWIARRLQHACSKLGTGVTRTAEQRFSIQPA